MACYQLPSLRWVLHYFNQNHRQKKPFPETENTEELAEAEEEPSVDADTNDVQANLEESAETSDEDSEPSVTEEETPVETEETTDNPDSETSSEEETQSTSASVLPQVNFTEASLMQWPVEGELMMDYSMENTTYFSTLDQYKLNPAIVVKAVVGAPVKAASNGTITSIADTAKTGTTLTMDMGNGYQSVYGQLTDLLVEEGQTVKRRYHIMYTLNQ